MDRLRPRRLRHRDLDELGVKVAWDHEGPPIEPDADLPPATPETEKLARGYVADRFPALAQAPLAGSTHLPLRALRRQPLHRRAAPGARPSVWLVGGGSGHGFKHGPAMAERLATAWNGGEPLPPHFALGERAKGESFRSAGSNF